MTFQDDDTNPDAPSAFKMIMVELQLVKQAAQSSANESVLTRSAVAEFRLELSGFRARLSAVEAERLWMPMAVATLALVVALLALVRGGHG